MSLKTTIATSVIVVTILLGTLFSIARDRKEAQAQLSLVPFSGKIATVMLCCNGLEFTFIHPPISAYATNVGTFIFQWQNMIPIPTIGWGLYSAWMMSSGTTVLGSASPGGVCVTVVSECESEEAVTWSISQMGTNITGLNT